MASDVLIKPFVLNQNVIKVDMEKNAPIENADDDEEEIKKLSKELSGNFWA